MQEMGGKKTLSIMKKTKVITEKHKYEAAEMQSRSNSIIRYDYTEFKKDVYTCILITYIFEIKAFPE